MDEFWSPHPWRKVWETMLMYLAHFLHILYSLNLYSLGTCTSWHCVRQCTNPFSSLECQREKHKIKECDMSTSYANFATMPWCNRATKMLRCNMILVNSNEGYGYVDTLSHEVSNVSKVVKRRARRSDDRQLQKESFRCLQHQRHKSKIESWKWLICGKRRGFSRPTTYKDFIRY